RNGEAAVKEKIQGREEFDLIYNSIKTQPILELGKKKRLDDPRRMLIAAEMWKFQCYSGLRIGETRLLNWGDIGEGTDPTGNYWEHGY
ncbi:MAG: hypothetical protein QF848_15825, partial [Planctomycetota bacterium]|nr:hypothetical protein [Planctomycetota bacterium]